MTDERLFNVLRSYCQHFDRQGCSPERLADNAKLAKDLDCAAVMNHICWMCHDALGHLRNNDRDKADRWLGFIQGYLFATSAFSIESLRRHSRPVERGEVPAPALDLSALN